MSDTTLVQLAVLAVVLLARWLADRRGATSIAWLLAAVALVLVAGLVVPVALLALVVVVPAGGLVCWHRRSRSHGRVTRWAERSRRKAGVASTWDLLRRGSAWPARRHAVTVRPSLRELSRRQRRRVPTTAVASTLCRVGWWRLWSSIENVLVVIGGPRSGKTGWLAARVLDAAGAVLVTSTRTDLHELTAELRARCGPVFVFNAVGLAGLDSTITFDPLTGCADPVTAAERATDMLADEGDGDRQWWAAQARRVLAALLHAAALGNRPMRSVLEWVAEPERSQGEVTSLLRRSPEPAYAADATQFLTTNDRTRSSITSSIMPALSWLTSPAACAAATGGVQLNVAELLQSRATVYLLGAEEGQSAPLVAALTGHIAREARRLAAVQPGGRLDPPLTLALDEAALICRVPLDSWTADMGGRGVHIIAAFQSRAQLISRWGATGAAVILNNAASILVFGGSKDRDDLNYWSSLAGDRDEPVVTTDERGQVTARTVRRVPVFSPAQLANLPAWHVVVFHRGMLPVIGRVRPAWLRRDVRALAAQQAAAAPAPAPGPVGAGPAPEAPRAAA